MEHDIEHGPESSAAAQAPDGRGPLANDYPEPEPGKPQEPAEPAERLIATGEPRVDGALRELGALGARPVSEHPPVFERVHGRLVEVLGELRADPDPAAQGRQAAD